MCPDVTLILNLISSPRGFSPPAPPPHFGVSCFSLLSDVDCFCRALDAGSGEGKSSVKSRYVSFALPAAKPVSSLGRNREFVPVSYADVS